MSKERLKELNQKRQYLLYRTKDLLDELKSVEEEIKYLQAHQINEYKNTNVNYRKGKHL